VKPRSLSTYSKKNAGPCNDRSKRREAAGRLDWGIFAGCRGGHQRFFAQKASTTVIGTASRMARSGGRFLCSTPGQLCRVVSVSTSSNTSLVRPRLGNTARAIIGWASEFSALPSVHFSGASRRLPEGDCASQPWGALISIKNHQVGSSCSKIGRPFFLDSRAITSGTSRLLTNVK